MVDFSVVIVGDMLEPFAIAGVLYYLPQALEMIWASVDCATEPLHRST